MDRIKLQSRYGDVETYYDPIDANHGILSTNGYYVRCVLDDNDTKITAVDFEGGPMLFVGNTLPGTDKKIKAIKACYYVELE